MCRNVKFWNQNIYFTNALLKNKRKLENLQDGLPLRLRDIFSTNYSTPTVTLYCLFLLSSPPTSTSSLSSTPPLLILPPRCSPAYPAGCCLPPPPLANGAPPTATPEQIPFLEPSSHYWYGHESAPIFPLDLADDFLAQRHHLLCRVSICIFPSLFLHIPLFSWCQFLSAFVFYIP